MYQLKNTLKISYIAIPTMYYMKIKTLGGIAIKSNGKLTINYNSLTIKKTNVEDLLPNILKIIPPIIKYNINVLLNWDDWTKLYVLWLIGSYF